MNSAPTVPSGLGVAGSAQRIRTATRFSGRLSGAHGVWLLSAAIAAAAAAIYLLVVMPLPAYDDGVQLPWIVLAAAFGLAEVGVIHLHVRNQAVTVSLSEIPLVLGFYFVAPADLVLAYLCGAAVALALVRRQRPVKLAFNLAVFALATSLAVMTFHAIVPVLPVDLLELWAASFVAAAVVVVVSALAITAAISIVEGRLQPGALRHGAVFGFLASLVNTSLALLAVVLYRSGPFELALLIAPAVVVFVAYRAFVLQRQRQARLEFMYDCARILQGPSLGADRVHELLTRARAMFRADEIEILLSSGDGAPIRAALGPGDVAEILVPSRSDLLAERLGRFASAPDGQLVPHSTASGRRSRFGLGWRPDAAIVPLRRGNVTVGTLMVAGRLGDLDGFDADDLHLLGTLGAHTAAALENARLLERLAASLADVSQLAAIVQSSDDAILAMTPEAVVTSWNPAAERLFGYRAAEITGRPAAVLVPPEQEDAIARSLRGQATGTPVRHATSTVTDRDGRRVPVSVTLSLVASPSGAITGLSAIVRDETERTRADAALRDSETETRLAEARARKTEAEFRRAVLAFTAVGEPAGVLRAVLTASRDLIDADCAAIEVLQGDGSALGDVLVEGMDEAVLQSLGSPPAGCGVLQMVSGESGPVRIGDVASLPTYPAPPGDGAAITSFLGVPIVIEDRLLAKLYLCNKRGGAGFTDLDEEVATALAAQAAISLENARIHARDIELVQRLDTANAELKRAGDAKSQFLASVSHELRTPLHSILVAADLVYDPLFGPLADERIRHLGATIQSSGRHLLHLIDDLVDLSRIEAGRLELHRSAVALGQLLGEISQLLGPLAAEKGIALDLPQDAGVRILADPLRLRQVLLNLVSNAIKFTGYGGRIWVDVESTPDLTMIAVHDTGIGIAAGDLERAFQPFEQVSGTSTPGAGLGLAISRQLIELHDGRLDVDSTLGAGSTFTVRLPSGRVRGGATTVEPAVARNVSPDLEPKDILVVEDDANALELVSEVLRRGGYGVRTASGVTEALDHLASHPPSLVLLDLRLGDDDGLDVAGHVRSTATTRELPVLAMSADATLYDVERVLAAGCDGYLIKPIRARELLSRVDALLALPAAPAEAPA